MTSKKKAEALPLNPPPMTSPTADKDRAARDAAMRASFERSRALIEESANRPDPQGREKNPVFGEPEPEAKS